MKTLFQKLKARCRALRSGRVFRSGAATAAVGAAMIAVVLLVNVLVGLIPVTYTEKDLTSIGLYTLSDYTKQYVGALTEPVTAYVVAETGSEDAMVEETLDRYAALSPNFTVRHVDPILTPTFVSKYTDKKLSNGSLILVSDAHPDRPYVLDYEDLHYRSYTEDEENYLRWISVTQGDEARAYYETQVGTTMYDAEKQITAGIDYVISDRLPHYYVISGHGGNGFDTTLTEAFSMANILLGELTLITVPELPEDTDGLILHAPQTDLNEEEAAMVSAYLAAGGTLVLTTGYDKIASLPRISAILAQYGLSGTSNIVVENDTDFCYYSQSSGYAQNMLIPLYSDHAVTDAFSVTRHLCVPIAHEIKVAEVLPTGVTVSNVLQTSEAASLITADTQAAVNNGTRSSQPIAVDAVKAGTDGKTSRVFWLSAPNFLTAAANSISESNYAYFITAMSVFTGKNVDFAIDAIALTSTVLDVQSKAAKIVWPIVLIGVLPVAIAAFGAVVCIRRRKR